MNVLTITGIVLYFGIMVFLALLGKRHTKSSTDYMLAGREIHPVIMGLSYGATFISTSAIVGFAGTAAQFGMGLLWLTFLNIFLGIFIAFVFFGKRVRTMGLSLGARTFPEFMGRRYNSKFIQVLCGSIMFVFMPIYAAAVLKGGVDFIMEYFRIPFGISLGVFTAIVAVYVLTGGLKGVMYTEAFQGGIMFCGMLFLIVYIYNTLGGVTAAHTSLTELYQNPAVQAQVGDTVQSGFLGWTSMPKAFSPIWWTVVSTIVLGVGIGVLAQPQLAVRFMTVKSNRELNRAVVSGGVFTLITTGVVYITGALSNVIFFADTGKISIVAAGGSDYIIPKLISGYLPPWFGIVFLLTLLSAAMSTLSSQFHAMGTAIGNDVYKPLTGKTGNTVATTKVGIIIGILLSVALTWLSCFLDQSSFIIASGTSLFFGLCAASFLPAYAAGLYSKTIRAKTAVISIVAGFGFSAFWIFFIHGKNATNLQLCRLITGKAHLLEGTSLSFLSSLDPIIIALPIAAITLIIAHLCVKKKDLTPQHIEKCFVGIK